MFGGTRCGEGVARWIIDATRSIAASACWSMWSIGWYLVEDHQNVIQRAEKMVLVSKRWEGNVTWEKLCGIGDTDLTSALHQT